MAIFNSYVKLPEGTYIFTIPVGLWHWVNPNLTNLTRRVRSALVFRYRPGFSHWSGVVSTWGTAKNPMCHRVSTRVISYHMFIYPICSMYGIFTNIYPINYPNVGKYTIHGAHGYIYIPISNGGKMAENMILFPEFSHIKQWKIHGWDVLVGLWSEASCIALPRWWWKWEPSWNLPGHDSGYTVLKHFPRLIWLWINTY